MAKRDVPVFQNHAYEDPRITNQAYQAYNAPPGYSNNVYPRLPEHYSTIEK